MMIKMPLFYAYAVALSALSLLSVCLLCATAAMADPALQGVTTERALIAVDGGKLHWFSVGESYAGITVRAINGKSVTIETNGQRQTLTLGDDSRLGGNADAADAQQITLHAGEGGHFMATGTINGASVRFLVDTGATMVAISSAEAQRIGLDYTKGQQATVATAGGIVHAYQITLDTMNVAGMTVNHVNALVQDNNSLPFILLGMSFLNRMNMQRSGDTMTLSKRY